MTCQFCNGFDYVVVLPGACSEGGRATCGNCHPDRHRVQVKTSADRIAELEEAIGMALKCTPSIGEKGIQYDCGDPWVILRAALNSSARSE